MSNIRIRIALPLGLAALCNVAWAAGTPAETLLEEYRCTICHAERDVGTGPAWVDIATHYRREPQAGKVVAGKIREGVRGGGPWHMPPHPEISQADAQAMALYILAIRK